MWRFIVAILLTCVFSVKPFSFSSVQAQDNPTPPPIELPILGTAVPTATPNPVQLFNALPAMGLQASDVPQFGNVTTTESPLSLEEMLAVLDERYPEQSALIPLLGSFYSSVGVLGSHETLLLAEDCAGLSLFGVGSWLRLLPGVTSANALVDNPLAAELYGSIFQWHREEDSRGLQGILYTASVPSDLCSIASTVYILDYQFGPVTVAVSAYAPSTTSPDVVLGAFPPLIERINQRISGTTGFLGTTTEAIQPAVINTPTVQPNPTPTTTLEQEEISGLWTGFLYQPSGGSQTSYPFEMNINQNSSSVTGTSRIEGSNSRYYAVMEIRGTFSNGILSFDEIRIQQQSETPGYYWCLKTGELTLVADDLTGTWGAQGCRGGTITLERVNR